ncbi:hypothetical protein [Deinococcus knuensis]|uniref:Uncharacterized protein n=1 Tax=Deinococcus knuensis TaxID=1837380 RepID=A0ABQ2SZJ2_9DEIO|nr:hypothetical protein [Deinococcus knuensis]GGS44823.1 hypothetical protein GCM10008961_39390 [Deinococcus knuensis]
MPERVNLNMEPPEPGGYRDWPRFVRHSYGANEGLTDGKENGEAYPYGYLGWFVRMGHHVASLIDEHTGRTDDAAVLAAALLLDVEAERSSQADHPEGLALLDEVQALLLKTLRQYSLPTGALLYDADEAAMVLEEWEPRIKGLHGNGFMSLVNYLDAVTTRYKELGKERVRRVTPTLLVEVSEVEMQADVAAQLRALAADVEGGTLNVREIRTGRRGSFVEVLIKGRVARGVPGEAAIQLD